VSVYMIIEAEVKDPKMYAEYIEQVPKVIEKYGGRYLARGNKIISLSEDWNPERMSIIEFDSVQKIKECFTSPEYKKVSHFREQGANIRAVVIEGCE
jgi:uncharacterized protein (DUF1330 family)